MREELGENKEKKETVAEKRRRSFLRRRRFFRLLTRLSLVVFLFTFLWVCLEGYHRLLSQEKIKEAAPLIKPLNPKLDEGVLQELRKRRFFSLLEVEKNFQKQVLLSGSESALPLEEAESNEKTEF